MFVRQMKTWPIEEAMLPEQFLSQGHYPPIQQQTRKSFICYITFRLISTMTLLSQEESVKEMDLLKLAATLRYFNLFDKGFSNIVKFK